MHENTKKRRKENYKPIYFMTIDANILKTY
jgi:hypothetical protein